MKKVTDRVTSARLNKTSVTTINSTISMLLVLITVVIHMSSINSVCWVIAEKCESQSLNLRSGKVPYVKFFSFLF